MKSALYDTDKIGLVLFRNRYWAYTFHSREKLQYLVCWNSLIPVPFYSSGGG